MLRETFRCDYLENNLRVLIYEDLQEWFTHLWLCYVWKGKLSSNPYLSCDSLRDPGPRQCTCEQTNLRAYLRWSYHCSSAFDLPSRLRHCWFQVSWNRCFFFLNSAKITFQSKYLSVYNNKCFYKQCINTVRLTSLFCSLEMACPGGAGSGSLALVGFPLVGLRASLSSHHAPSLPPPHSLPPVSALPRSCVGSNIMTQCKAMFCYAKNQQVSHVTV